MTRSNGMARRKKVLIAGNSGDRIAVIRRTLARIGYGLKVVEPGNDFLKTVRRWGPDLIILAGARFSPGQATLLQLLRADSRTRRVPVLSLLESRPSPRVWARIELTDDVVRAPVTPEELAIRVRTLLRLAKLTHETRRKLMRFQAQARIDPLTGLATRGAFRDRIAREFHRADRYHRPLALLIADVDHFKHYNDNCGHPAGDRLLRQVGRMVAGQIRRVDFGARYGGDEFAIILPETTKGAAGSLAERLRATIENHPFPHCQSQPLGKVTLSIGVATFPGDGRTQEALVEAADRALYLAKADGRNLVREAWLGVGQVGAGKAR